jgi:hypothetical protein
LRCPVCRYDIRTENLTEPSNDEEEEEEETPPPPPDNTNVNRLVQNLSTGIQNVIQNYLERDLSTNPTFTFEVPFYIYNDLSGNYL